MKVILLKDIKGVGKRFDEKEVSDGYATNFLIPKKLVVPLSPASASAIKQLKEQSESKKALEEKRLNEKSTKRMEKSLELEKFRQASLAESRREQRSSPSS